MQERRLYRMQVVAHGKAFDRRDPLASSTAHGQRQTGEHAPAVDVHGACATGAAVAAGQPRLLA